ncbi:hypothetical protein CPB84DRAFT_1812351 [Gymnopilus junonius]|uniref:Uncharacterized protein n=1 Tax=Gymnopilus junonius TaxID=109634 RepID=A0A9P5NWE0_GYMJU|nr:hypothetical protein CPB84DRAFT_1812351 [Gymnopilus junonius]
MTNKLKLKRTPEEEARHRLKKEKRRAKRKRHHYEYDSAYGPSSSKRAHLDEEPIEPERKWASSDEDAEIEEKLFREKLFDNLEEDERLDAVEARMNDFGHVPDRWRTTGSSQKVRRNFNEEENDEYLKLDPRYMDDEEYVEWIRVGMYRKTHAEEYAEQQRKKAAQAARRAEEKARKAEAEKLEKEAEEERERKKAERESRRMDYAREEYQARWTKLLAATESEQVVELTFDDIPWPIFAAHRDKPPKEKDKRHANGLEGRAVRTSELTEEAISTFLLPNAELERDGAAVKKERKERLREAFLRFHPDKFEGRFMKRVKESKREKVREAIGQVSRVLNALMAL